ncbi:MAG: LamG domain-containing protein [Ferruginibacter sp.]
MKQKIKNIIPAAMLLLSAGIVGTGCTKADYGDDFAKGDAPAVAGGFTNSSEVASANLVAHFPFEGNINDVKNGVTGGVASGTTSFVTGRKGQAYKGSANGFIVYSTPGPIATLTSFTVSLWVNTSRHDGGAMGLFALGKQDGSFWGNFFLFIEGQNPATPQEMFMKLHFEKNNAPFVEHWLEPNGDFRAKDMYGAWRHIAWTYDAATSKVGWFINGQKKALPPGADARVADGNNTPLGALNFKNATKFVIGGFQNNAGAPFSSPEPWMLNYTGMLDEFRVYNKALSEVEISAIQVLERQGR